MTFSHDWFSPAIPVLEKVLSPFVGKSCLAIEIGSYEGRSACWFMEHVLTHESSKLVCIDTFEGGLDHQRAGIDFKPVLERFKSNVTPWQKKIWLMVGRSEAFLRHMDLAYDFAFIDGSHLAKDVLLDAALTWPLIKPGGVVVFDDYLWGQEPGTKWQSWETPKPAIDGFLACHANELDLLHSGYHVAVRKKGGE